MCRRRGARVGRVCDLIPHVRGRASQLGGTTDSVIIIAVRRALPAAVRRHIPLPPSNADRTIKGQPLQQRMGRYYR